MKWWFSEVGNNFLKSYDSATETELAVLENYINRNYEKV